MALVVSQLIVLADEPGPLLTTYATDREVWAVNVDSPQAPTGITAQAFSERTLEERITKLLKQPAAQEGLPAGGLTLAYFIGFVSITKTHLRSALPQMPLKTP
ncbi:hypothetical protein OOK12_27140 [Streptomyces sp. NBC_00452]|uniref:hypothetical protein n=1 Tax=Streptomyces sp. NBC_00452 TaxID=2975746 RepID=UPI00224DEECA|nr:hypothetical protein [Streptomyces sp. NBC_00452]MCX5060631.1 hypothetical protein [Streptomyces sp. NBC_00452]